MTKEVITNTPPTPHPMVLDVMLTDKDGRPAVGLHSVNQGATLRFFPEDAERLGWALVDAAKDSAKSWCACGHLAYQHGPAYDVTDCTVCPECETFRFDGGPHEPRGG